MRKDALAFAVVGFVAAFMIVSTVVSERAREVLEARPAIFQAPVEPPPSPGAPAVDAKLIERLRREIEQNPKDFDALVQLANLNHDQQNFEEAASLYGRALEVRDDLNVRSDLGISYFYSRRFDQALAEFRKCLERDPTHPQALFNSGVVLLQGKNDPEGALQAWEKLAAAHPTFPNIGLVQEQIRSLKEQLKK